ncbi:hypothetical protein [Mycolicibacterium frederiksbergense]|uniref:hypothetical protein n=1 Tax=Mycolicibacterium frederiksbergense TaxID=117567 RepID=UPI00265BBE74|nr:hypothetical protein [Mycolicibacterium frederiksbergense]MDO0976023.1 hypothetical protein [Mycolicibacterium frederiksbergense]
MTAPIAAYGVRRAVLRHLAAVAPQSIAGAKLRVMLRSTNRHALDGVLAELARDGLIVYRPARCGGRRFALAPQSSRTNRHHNMIGDRR